jgi:hypothetical protein
MNWSDERYVRVYTRDTADWLSLSFLAQGLFCLILRKVDRAGVMQLGRHGRKAVAITVGHAGDWPRLEPALEELLADGCVIIKGDLLVVPNFMEAQEAAMSDAQRQRESREKRLARAMAEGLGLVTAVTGRDIPSQNVTGGHESGENVTSGHAASQPVTPSVPSLPSENTHTLGGDARTAGAEAAAAFEAKHPHNASPLTDDVIKALRAAGKTPAYPSPPSRAPVEAAIAGVGVPVATTRILAAWTDSKPWLTFYLEAITGQNGVKKASKDPNPKAMAPVGQDWSAKPW